MAATSRSLLGLVILCLNCGQFVTGCVVNLRNNCPSQITACSQSLLANVDQHELPAGGSATIDLGDECLWPSATVYASVTGQCGADRSLANLAEMSLDAINGQNFYDLSNVNAYAMGLAVIPSKAGCRAIGCIIPDIRSFCQPYNRLVTLPTGALSCVNTDASNQTTVPTNGTSQFKKECPEAYSYSFDDASSVFTCGSGTSYDVVFCP